jgi:hypothetical protein
MPITIGKKKLQSFAAAVKFIMASKGWSKKRASAYVAGIEDKEKPGWRK